MNRDEKQRITKLEDGMEMAWIIIANAMDWDNDRPEWRAAAEKWRDEWHQLLATSRGVPSDKAEEPARIPQKEGE